MVADARFKDDAYVTKRRPRSVLCAPLSLKSKHHGLILLENDMSAGVFGDDRLQLVSILAGQLMNSLENALLADELRRANHRMARKNKRLEEMDSAKDAFLAVASHELRTPLTGISGMAGLMEDTAMSDYQGECLRDIEAESETLLELVNDVLDLSKLKAMKVALAESTFGLEELLEESFAIIADRITTDNRVTMRFVIDGEVPRYVTTDRGRLLQLIGSLVRHTISLSDTSAGSETIVTISLQRVGQLEESRETIRMLPKPTAAGLRFGRRPSLTHSIESAPSLTEAVTLHVRVQGTTMTIGEDEFAELFDPFTPVAGLARPAKFSSVGLGTNSFTLLFSSLFCP